MRVVTWLGSMVVIIPLGLITGGWFARRREWRPLILLTAAVAGAVALYDIIKHLVGRPRPPRTIWIGHFPAAAFPSGHATQTVAFYSVLAIIIAGAGRSRRVKLTLWSAAVLVALVVGASRIYLGVHWLTDVLGGYELGAFWAAAVVIAMLIASARGNRGGRA